MNDPSDRPADAGPNGGGRPRIRVSTRVAAVAGLAVVVFMGVVATALAAPAPAQTGSLATCVNEAISRVTAEAIRVPASERAAYIRREVEAARARCAAIVTGTTTTTPATTTTTTPPTTTTTPPPTTTTTPPPTTTTTPPPARYEVVDTGVIGPGRQTLEANCNPGDRVVDYDYVVGSPSGSNTSRNVSVNNNGRGVTVTYEVTGTVANRQTSLTVVCRRSGS